MHEPIDRRRFMTTTAQAALVGGVAAAVCGSPAPVRAGQFTDKIKKAVKYHMIAGDDSPEEKLKLLKDLGYDGVEPRAMLKPEQAAEVAAIARASEKLDFPYTGLSIPPIRTL